MLNKWTNRYIETSTHWYWIMAKTRAEFSFINSMKNFTQNYCFQESGWLLLPGSLADFWTHGFLVKAFHEKFNVTSYYAEGTLILYISTFYWFDWRLLQYQHETLSFQVSYFLYLKTFEVLYRYFIEHFYEEFLQTLKKLFVFIVYMYIWNAFWALYLCQNKGKIKFLVHPLTW